MGLWVNVLILLLSLIVLDKASDLTINNSVKISDITGFGKTTIGFILVAFSTSLPELLVSIFAAIQPQNIGVAIGNVLGSNIVNICLILGACFLIVALRYPERALISPRMAKEETGSLYFGLFIASVVPLTLLYIGYASQFIGIALLAIFVYYIYRLLKWRNIKEEGCLGKEKQKLRSYVLFTILGASGVVASAYFLVDTASFIATEIGVPKVVIGATLIALGTSIPELATSISAVRKGHPDLALGNIVGSCFINITCILGIALAVSPLRIDMEAFSHLIIFSLITNIILWYFLSSEKISWREGAVLLSIYALFLITSFSQT
jgi:cation:H+ antiporter